MTDGRRLPTWREDLVCAVCPSLTRDLGGFDVHDRPSRTSAYDPAADCRVTAAGVPVCVHPDRVGLPPGAYASGGQPLPPDLDWEDPPPTIAAAPVPAAPADPPPPTATPPPARALVLRRPRRDRPRSPDVAVPAADDLPRGLPADPAELDGWIRHVVLDAAPDRMALALAAAEQVARERFTAEQVVAALRRVLSSGIG